MRELQARYCGGVIFRVHFNAIEATADLAGRYARRSGTGERIQDNVTRFAECLDKRRQAFDRLLGGVVAIATVFPWHHVGQRDRRRGGLALSQQVGRASC